MTYRHGVTVGLGAAKRRRLALERSANARHGRHGRARRRRDRHSAPNVGTRATVRADAP